MKSRESGHVGKRSNWFCRAFRSFTKKQALGWGGGSVPPFLNSGTDPLLPHPKKKKQEQEAELQKMFR